MDRIDPLKACIVQLSRFPGIGERTATRLVYWLLRQSPDVAAAIGAALQALPAAMTRCERCGNISAVDPCSLCSDVKRSGDIVCVVERPQDVQAIEATRRLNRLNICLLYTSPSPRDLSTSRMPSSA